MDNQNAGSFRPLSGINFNSIELQAVKQEIGFRPLTGINFNTH